jgi:co-chaperonin GroES (HSP10)
MYSFTDAAVPAELLPVPTGYHLLLEMPEVSEKTAGGIIRPDSLKEKEEVASIAGRVISMGPLAYTDPDKFEHGAWCKQGDWVIVRSYSGTRFKIQGREYRIINDDTVEAVVPKPEVLERA